MDYQEAIKEAEAQIDMYEAFILYNKDLEPKNDNSNYEFKMDFLKTSISAMRELQMYKDNKLCLIPDDVYSKQCEELDEYEQLGTPEGLEDIIQNNFNAVELVLISCSLEQLIKYQQLGTLEEVQEAVEKQNKKEKIKKVLSISGQKSYECGYCGCFVEKYDQHCKWCGQKLDWGEENEYCSKHHL